MDTLLSRLKRRAEMDLTDHLAVARYNEAVLGRRFNMKPVKTRRFIKCPADGCNRELRLRASKPFVGYTTRDLECENKPPTKERQRAARGVIERWRFLTIKITVEETDISLLALREYLKRYFAGDKYGLTDWEQRAQKRGPGSHITWGNFFVFERESDGMSRRQDWGLTFNDDKYRYIMSELGLLIPA